MGFGAGGGARTGVTTACRGKRGRGTGRGRGTWGDAGRGSAGFGALREAGGTDPGAAGTGGRGVSCAGGPLPGPGSGEKPGSRLCPCPLPSPMSAPSRPRGIKPRRASLRHSHPPGPVLPRVRGFGRQALVDAVSGFAAPSGGSRRRDPWERGGQRPWPRHSPCAPRAVSARREGPAVVRGRGAEQPVPGEAGAAGEPGKPGTRKTRRTERGKGGPEPGAGGGNVAERWEIQGNRTEENRATRAAEERRAPPRVWPEAWRPFPSLQRRWGPLPFSSEAAHFCP